MKKLLLTLAAVVGLGFAATAETYTIQFKADPNSGNTGTLISETTTVTNVVESGEDYVASFSDCSQAYAACNSGLKIGANKQAGSITINLSDAGMVNASKVEVYASASKNPTYQKLTVDGTEFSFTTDETKDNFKVCEITPNKGITAIVLKKTNASTTSKEQGFIFVNKIVVTYTTSGETKDPAGLKYETSQYTVKEGNTFETPVLTNPNNLAVTYSSSEETVATVDKTTGNVTIVGAGTTTITAQSEETDKYYAGKASYTLTVVKTYKTVAEFYTVGKNGKGFVGFDLIVTYVDGLNCYAETADGEATLIYGTTPYAVGDVIPAGWEGQYTPYNGMPEIKPVGTMPEASETGKTVTYKEATEITLNMVNQIVVLKGVTFDAATPAAKDNFTGKIGETSIPFRNNFTVASVEAGKYDVTCAVGYYGAYNATEPTDAAKLQVYPIEYNNEAYVGIEDIEADNNAPVEYFNLQGVRVANPENGLFIRRQGNKVTKVIVK